MVPSAPTHSLWVTMAEALSQDFWDGSCHCLVAQGTSTKKEVTGYWKNSKSFTPLGSCCGVFGIKLRE